MKPIERIDVETAGLVSRHPPVIDHPHKALAMEIACPSGCEQRGALAFSRWGPAPLPQDLIRSSTLAIDVRPDVFTYDSATPPNVEWHVNFSDPSLFCAYGGPLLAQDELQVAEHPALGSLLEMLLVSEEATPVTVEGGQPTPVLVAGVERRLVVHTEPSAKLGRPDGLYGNLFAAAPREVVERALEPVDPPTTTNVLAMAAPAPGSGSYDLATIEYVMTTAITGFSASVAESRRLFGTDARVFVHTGFWGCGAFGGNRTLMVGLQLLAASAAGLDGLVFHAVTARGVDDFEEGRQLTKELLPDAGEARPRSEIVFELLIRNHEWGVSDGN